MENRFQFITHFASTQQKKIGTSFFWGNLHLYNRNELSEIFPDDSFHSDEEFIVNFLKKLGPKSIAQVNGDFAFILYVEELDEYWIFKDKIGTQPLFFVEKDSTYYFSETIHSLSKLHKFHLNLEYIKNEASYIKGSIESTFFQEIKRFKPAHWGILRKGEALKCFSYWELKQTKLYEHISREQAILKARALIEKSILKRINTSDRVGSQLSGGLDSSLITAIIQKHRRLNATFSFVLNEKTREFSKNKIDEQDAQSALLKFANISTKNHHLIDSFHYKDVEESLKLRNKIMASFCLSDGYWQDTLFKKAYEKDITVVFSGYPGDEGISNNGNRWFLNLFYYNKSIELFKLFLENPIDFFKYLKNYLTTYFLKNYYFGFVIKRNLLKNPINEKTPNIKGFIPTLNSYLLDNLSKNYITLRSESENLYAKQYNIRVVYPFADADLLEFVVSLPAHVFKPGKRAFFRSICEGYLPEKIIHQPKDNGALTLAFAEYWYEQMFAYFKENKTIDSLGLFVSPDQLDLNSFEERLKFIRINELCYFINENK